MGIQIIPNANFNTTIHYDILFILMLIFIFFIIYGYIKNGRSFEEYKNYYKNLEGW